MVLHHDPTWDFNTSNQSVECLDSHPIKDTVGVDRDTSSTCGDPGLCGGEFTRQPHDCVGFYTSDRSNLGRVIVPQDE